MGKELDFQQGITKDPNILKIIPEEAYNEINNSKTRVAEINDKLDRAKSEYLHSGVQHKIKNVEDIVTLVTLTLLAACLIFMILVNGDWKFYFFDYSLTSRLFFAIGLLSLLVRVGLRARD